MNNKNTINTEPTMAQLKHCVQLLSHSLAQHRKKCESIPLIDALPLVSKTNVSDEPQYQPGSLIYREALELSKSSLAPIDVTIQEHRTQPRINTSTLVKIIVPATGVEWEGNLTNISWGGLRIRTKELIGEPNYTLNVSLPYPDETNIHIQAKIVRSWKDEDMYNTAIRFTNISQKNEQKLNNLLGLLLNEDDKVKCKGIPFAQCIDVSYWDGEELKATLEDISKGGMKIMLPEPVELNKSIKVQLDGPDDIYNLSLRARVIRRDKIKIAKTEMYHIALQFEHPTKELHSMIGGVIQNMMEKGIIEQNISEQAQFVSQ